MIVGSFSSNVYGIARSTKDADFVIQLGDQTIGSLATVLGVDFRLDAQLAFETVTGTTKFRLTHRDTEFTIELFVLSQDPHDQSRFTRRILKDIAGQGIYVPTAEDVIITKLRWALRLSRRKDIDDVQGVLDVQAGQIDLQYLHYWTDQHGTRGLLEEMLSKGHADDGR
jgi:hypothetical protein